MLLESRSHERIYEVVGRIPSGRVASYGQVAKLAGLVNGARQVGYALAALRPGRTVPWHRVVNARGHISVRAPGSAAEQRYRLEREGVRFGADGRIDLATYGWDVMGFEVGDRQ